MTDTSSPAAVAPTAVTPRSKTGIVLWVTSVAVFVLSVIVGIAIASATAGEDSLSSLAAIFVPIMASIVYAPLNIGALIVSIVNIRKPGARAPHEYVALIGSAITALLALPLFGVFALVYGGGM